MAKSLPEYMGTYKAIVLEWGITKKEGGLPQFVIRVALTDYYDTKESEWLDCSGSSWVMNGWFSLYGRKDSQPDGEIIETLNHQQVCKVFDWDGCGFDGLTEPGKFDGKVVQVRVAENDPKYVAKNPVVIEWVDTEDADPVSGLRVLDKAQVKKLNDEFSHLWKGKKTPAAVTAKPKTIPQTKAVKETKPPVEETPVEETKEDRKKALLEKSKRLRNEAKKAPPAPAKKTEPPVEETKESGVPEDYNKNQAWSDIIDLRAPECTDEQQKASWLAAIAETAEDGEEDKLDAAGWWAVKEQVVAEIGTF